MRTSDDTTPLDNLARGPSRAGGARWTGWPLALVLVWVALAALDLVVIAPFGTPSRHQAGKAAGPPGGAGHRHAGTGTSHRRHGSPSASVRPSASPSASPSESPLVLIPVSASAFGPSGLSSGDNPQNAPLAIDGSATTAWQTQWYASADFGNLKAGTGLLVDMGRPVRIASARILLGNATGADLQVLTGNLPVMSQERVQAQASDVGGAVRLTLARPRRVRYLLIWFTHLPPDSAGTFRATVYSIRLEGISLPVDGAGRLAALR